MPFPIPLDDLLDITDQAEPCTYVNAAGVAKDIAGLFKRDDAESKITNLGYQNTAPMCWLKWSDIVDVSKGAMLLLHTVWEDEDTSDYVVDENGDIIIIEDIAEYYITHIHENESGLVQVDLSLDPMQ